MPFNGSSRPSTSLWRCQGDLRCYGRRAGQQVNVKADSAESASETSVHPEHSSHFRSSSSGSHFWVTCMRSSGSSGRTTPKQVSVRFGEDFSEGPSPPRGMDCWRILILILVRICEFRLVAPKCPRTLQSTTRYSSLCCTGT